MLRQPCVVVSCCQDLELEDLGWKFSTYYLVILDKVTQDKAKSHGLV